MNGKRKAPAVHLLRLDRGKVIKSIQSYQKISNYENFFYFGLQP